MTTPEIQPSEIITPVVETSSNASFPTPVPPDLIDEKERQAREVYASMEALHASISRLN